MGNNNNKILEKDDLYSRFTEGIYYPKRPLKAFKKIKCDDKLYIAELLSSNRIEKKAGYCYPHEGESYPSYELNAPAYALNIHQAQCSTLKSYYWTKEDNRFINGNVAYTIISRLRRKLKFDLERELLKLDEFINT